MFFKYLKKNLIILKIVLFCISSLFLFNCAGTLEQDLKKLDQIYGYCDNPQRNIRGNKYQICKDKQAAMGPGGKAEEVQDKSLTKLFERFTGGSENSIVVSNTNPFLWRAALEVVNSYDLKIADNEGGYIQTEWIYQPDNADLRCMIKINVNSAELISTGVETTLNCQKQKNSIWEADGIVYTDEEKKLTLRILELAQTYFSQK